MYFLIQFLNANSQEMLIVKKLVVFRFLKERASLHILQENASLMLEAIIYIKSLVCKMFLLFSDGVSYSKLPSLFTLPPHYMKYLAKKPLRRT